MDYSPWGCKELDITYQHVSSDYCFKRWSSFAYVNNMLGSNTKTVLINEYVNLKKVSSDLL